MFYGAGGRDVRNVYQNNYLTVQRYLSLKCQKKEVKDFFLDYDMKRIAVYGIGELGKCLIQDLLDTEIQVAYIVDRNYSQFPCGYYDIPVIGLDTISEQEMVDVVVITALVEINRIIDGLLEKGISLECIININDVVFSL